MRTTILTLALGAMGLLLFAACETSDGGGGTTPTGPTCNPVCGEGYQCVYVEGTTQTTCELAPTTTCDPACGTDQTCVNGVCQDNSTGDTCTPACGTGQTCVNGVCQNTTAGCTSDTECGMGLVCDNGTCVVETTGCTSDAECGTGLICDDGTCVADTTTCTSDTDCPTDFICEEGACVPDSATCSSDDECPADFICEEGACVLDSTDCTSDAECDTGYVCQYGDCVLDSNDCTSDADCGTGYVCQSGECVVQTVTGLTCLEINDCVAEDCAQYENDETAYANCAQACVGQGDASAQSTFMAMMECFYNNGCSDQACAETYCMSEMTACASGGSTTPECTTDADCGSGETCMSGYCVTAGAGTCNDIYACSNECEDDACVQSCLAMGDSSAQNDYMAFMQCASDNGCADMACVTANCSTEMNTCLGGSSDACGDIDYVGVCEGDVVKWCEGGELAVVDCAAEGMTCGFIEEAGWYYCM